MLRISVACASTVDFQDSSNGERPDFTRAFASATPPSTAAAHAGLKLAQKGFLLGGDFLRQLRPRRVKLHTRFAEGPLRFLAKTIKFLARLALNFIGEGGGGGFRGFGEERACVFEGVADDLFHLRLRMADEAAAGVIQFAGEDAGDFSCFFTELILGLRNGFFGQALNLSLRFFLVPFGGFHAGRRRYDVSGRQTLDSISARLRSATVCAASCRI